MPNPIALLPPWASSHSNLYLNNKPQIQTLAPPKTARRKAINEGIAEPAKLDIDDRFKQLGFYFRRAAIPIKTPTPRTTANMTRGRCVVSAAMRPSSLVEPPPGFRVSSFVQTKRA
jgi:hypothetical protein